MEEKIDETPETSPEKKEVITTDPTGYALASIEAKHPKLIAELKETYYQKGQIDDRKRVSDIMSATVPGFETLAQEYIKTGATSAEFALAMCKQIKLNGEKASLANIKADSQIVEGIAVATQIHKTEEEAIEEAREKTAEMIANA